MLQFTGCSLDDVGQGVSYSDALAIIIYPPKGSYVQTEMAGMGEVSEWGLTEWLIAELIDELRAFFSAIGGSKKDPPRVLRPGVDNIDNNETHVEVAAIPVDEIENFLRVKRV